MSYKQNEIVFNQLINEIGRQVCRIELWGDINIRIPLFGKRIGYCLDVYGWYDSDEQRIFSVEIKINGLYPFEEEFEITGRRETETRDVAELKIVVFDMLHYLDQYIKNTSPREEKQQSKPKKKFVKGGHILSLDELYRQEYVYWNHKVTHIGWFQNWTLRMSANAIGENGCIYYAEIERNELDDHDNSNN